MTEQEPRHRPLGRRTTLAAMLSVGLALLVASLALTAIQFVMQRRVLLDEARLQAGIIGRSGAAALAFRDAEAAGELLDALRIVPYVQAAAIYDAQGLQLAAFARTPDWALPPELPPPAASWRPASLSEARVAAPIRLREQSLGSVQLRLDLRFLYRRLLGYGGLMLLIVVISVGASAPLVARLRRDVISAERHLDHIARTDPITGLQNRYAFNAAMLRALRESGRRRIGLALLDLDNFKIVNDTLGHNLGDRLLRTLALRLRTAAYPGDGVYRMGGDEFAVVMTQLAAPEEPLLRAQTMLSSLARPLLVDGREIRLGASIGVCVTPDDGSDLETLTRNADIAMYHAKNLGKNACAAFQPAMQLIAQRRLAMEQDLHLAIERGELSVHYQPQIRLADGQIVGTEALLRWNHPSRGAVSPLEFVPVAEECGLIEPIGRWVLQQACQQAAHWYRAGSSARYVAVNVSVRQLRAKTLLRDVEDALRQCGLPAQCLELEITESMLMDAIETNVAQLRALRAMGVRVAIDDFGTGYSSLSYLPTLPVTLLKIDRSFISGIPGDGATITTAIVDLAERFGLNVLAEGVEQEEQAEFLRRAGCAYAQGWLYAPALPAETLTRALTSGAPPYRRLAELRS